MRELAIIFMLIVVAKLGAMSLITLQASFADLYAAQLAHAVAADVIPYSPEP